MGDGSKLIDALARRHAAPLNARRSDAEEVSLHFPARHPSVGDAAVFASPHTALEDKIAAWVSVGQIVTRYQFADYDSHRSLVDRWERLTADVTRFIDRLFDDRLLLWHSEDRQIQGWREGAEGGPADVPLVVDDHTYALYVWSGPLGKWRATDMILARRVIATAQEHFLLVERLRSSASDQFDAAESRLARRLIDAYERRANDASS